MKTATADVSVEVKKTAPAQTNVPDVWHSFRGEMDRLFDRFGGGFGFRRCAACSTSSRSGGARSASRCRSERAYGLFQRALDLPASVDRDKVGSDFSKGV
jgi:hypothetical protein